MIAELKNELVIKGTLLSSDNVMNVKLIDVEILNRAAFPHVPRVSSCIIRGSSVKYIHLPLEDVDLGRLTAMSRESPRAPPFPPQRSGKVRGK